VHKSVAEKLLDLLMAEIRQIRFGDPLSPKTTIGPLVSSQERATGIYTKYHAGGVLSAEEYRDLQDFIFRYLLPEAGRLHLPAQIHTAVGGGDYFSPQLGTRFAEVRARLSLQHSQPPVWFLSDGIPERLAA
jgi:hypothetical protein